MTTQAQWKQIIDMETKVWRLMEEAADYGWQFDLEKAYNLVDALTAHCVGVETKLKPVLPGRYVQLTKTESGATKAFKADGSYTTAAVKWSTEGLMGDFCRVKYEEFNIGSDSQVKEYLLTNGWKPKEYNFKKDRYNKPVRDDRGNLIKTSPKLPKSAEDWDEVAVTCNTPDIALLAEYNKASHRLSQIKGLIANVRADHRIEAQANTCGTNTARMTHRIVVNIPKADDKIYYGKEMRSLFIASPGKVLVGCDASALEARVEAHYTYPYDAAAAAELIDGDIHSRNAEIFQTSRSIAKNGKYAILYGCSPAKLAATIGKPLKMSKQIYDDYWSGNPGLKQLKEEVEKEYVQKGHLMAIDGRPLTIRYKHAIINTLFQSCGAIAIKIALCIANRDLRLAGIEAQLLGCFHDEVQFECNPEDAEKTGQILAESVQKAGLFLKLNVPLDAEWKLGSNWSETH